MGVPHTDASKLLKVTVYGYVFESHICIPLMLVLYVATLDGSVVLPALMLNASLSVAQLLGPAPVLAVPPVMSYRPVAAVPPAPGFTVTVPVCAAVGCVSDQEASKLHDVEAPGARDPAGTQVTCGDTLLAAVLKVTDGAGTASEPVTGMEILNVPLTRTVCAESVLATVSR